MPPRSPAVILAAIAIAVTILLNCSGSGPGSVGSAAEAPLPDTLALAFYNVENLFDFNLDGTEYDEYKPGWFGWSAEMQRKKLSTVAEVVAAIGADVVGLCEVENIGTLAELQRALDKMGAPYPYLAAAEAKGSATVTALLSKFPIRGKAAHPVEGSRSILEVKVARGGDEILLFVNHWPSKRHPESKRLEAAEILRRRIDALPKGTDYIVMGDLNANHDEFASFHTQGLNDTKGVTGVNHVLKTTLPAGARKASPTRFVCKGELSACHDCHYNLWMDVDEDMRMSYVYRGAKQTIDNMLVPQALFDTVGYSYVNGSFEAFTWGGRLLREGVPYRWQMVFKGNQKYHRGEGYSDHLPIVAKLARAKVLSRDGGDDHNGDNHNGDNGDNGDGGDGDDGYNGNNGYDGYDDNCERVDQNLSIGDFETSVDGWVSGGSGFTVARDKKIAKNGKYSLRISGTHETENRTAAKARLVSTPSQKLLTMAIKGEGSVSVRVRRQEGKWTYYNAPEFVGSKNARYKGWKSEGWETLSLPLPLTLGGGGYNRYDGDDGDDVDVEIRSGKGEGILVWIDRVRLE